MSCNCCDPEISSYHISLLEDRIEELESTVAFLVKILPKEDVIYYGSKAILRIALGDAELFIKQNLAKGGKSFKKSSALYGYKKDWLEIEHVPIGKNADIPQVYIG